MSFSSLFTSMESVFLHFLVEPLSSFLFFDIAFFNKDISLPFILVWLLFGAIFLTIKMGFIHLKSFKHAIDVIRGKYDEHSDPGEVSHFAALSSALSGTLGLGNISGVALAISIGGPGAVFWMIIAGFFGMSAKFAECSLAVMYRQIDKDGKVLGGPMLYIKEAFKEKGYQRLGAFLSSLFAVLCIGGSLGGGNMFQANQSYAAVANMFPYLKDNAWMYGLFMAFIVGLVIIGGIKRIGSTASIIVPFMCIFYLLCGIWIILANWQMIPSAFVEIYNGAFNPQAGYGGIIGVLVVGFRRAAFSNEAGIGSAAIAHSAVATKEPIREGIVACLEPFIDTILVCTMTGLVVVITGVYKNTALKDGVLMTSEAFAQGASWMPAMLVIAIVLFAFSTMISWSYYGERCWAYLFNTSNTLPYKIIFLFSSFLGSVFAFGPVLEFSDLMILGMSFPNMLGIILLSGKLKSALDDYWGRYKSEGIKRSEPINSVNNEYYPNS